MNDFIKQIIEENFASKNQKRFFFAKDNEKGIPKSKKKKRDSKFFSKTGFDQIPDKVEEKERDSNQTELEFTEIVDNKGNIGRSKKPSNSNTKGVTQGKTTDEVVKNATGQMGTYGTSFGTSSFRRYWGESDMSKSLGYEDTLGQDADLGDAEKHFKKELGMDDSETKERLNQMGYDKDLPNDKVRLVENPKRFIEEYIDSLLKNRTTSSDLVSKESKEINPIVKKQIKSLKQSMISNNLTIDDIIKHLKDNE